MSTVFSRNKEKRPRSGSEANNSFVKNVTSRVSGLLPATITKWFSSPSSSNANGTASAADVTDSSTEDEATENPISSQPPAKRMRFSTPGKNNRSSPTDGNSVSRVMESTDSPALPYNTVQSPPGRNTFRRETNFVSTPIRANEETVVERVEKDTPAFKTQHSVSVIGQSVATKRKSLFEALSPSDSGKAKPTANTSRDLKQPYFKPALLGSPFYHGRTMYGGAASSYMNQPNIKQRKVAYVNESNNNDTATMSHSTRRIMDLLENYSSPLTEAKRIPHYVKPPRHEIAKSNTEGLQDNKLNSYKMQELQIPGIASIMRLKQKSRLMDSTSAARQLMASYSSASEFNPYPPATSNTQKENNSKETNTNLTTKVKTRVTRQLRGESANEAPPPPVQLPNIVLKIDTLPKFTLEKPVPSTSAPPALSAPSVSTSLTSPALSALPSAAPTIPTLKAATVSAITTTTSSTSSPMSTTGAAISSVFSIPYYITMSSTSTYSSKTGITSNNSPFKFSSPVKVSTETTENCKTPPRFAFGSPDRSIDRPKVDDKKADSSVVVGSIKETAKVVDKTNDWKCSECWVSNKPNVDKCVCCGNKRDAVTVETPVKCSVCKLANSQPNGDKCVNCEKLQSKSTSASVIKPANQSQWKCSECWVSNDENVDKCVCCGANNPKKSNIEATKSTSSEHIWKCFICWVTNKNDEENCSSCGNSRNFASFNKPAKCTVCKLANSQPHCDKCANCEKNEQNITAKPTDKPQWKCDACWVSNEETAEKCVCCGATNPKKAAASTNKVENVTNGNDWKCDDCWITNKSHMDKCDACGGPRPGAKSSSTRGFGGITPSSVKSSDDVFKSIAISQKGSKWECSSCLVRNDEDKTICICCGADKEYKTVNVGLKPFNFGQNTNTTFKFGINNDQQNNNVTTMEHTSMGDEVAIDECEKNNNVVEKVPTFTFALPAKKSEETVTKENKSEAPKINFNFGIPKQTTEIPATNNLFEAKKPVEEKQNLQEVPKVDVSSSTTTLIKPIPVLFTPPPANTSTPTPEVLALLGSESTTKLSKSGPTFSTPKTTTSLPENKFSFSASGIKSNMNMFTPPVSNTGSAVGATTSSLFAPPPPPAITTTAAAPIGLFQKPETVTTSTVTMFTNKDPAVTSTISLFPPSELVTTTASQPVSFFNFGSNTQTTTQPAAEKPKFNFQFGIGNKSETPAVFKPSFGSLGDNNTNKFTLPATNILGGGNGLSGNPLGGTNGLSAGNPLTGNISTGNILGSNNDLSINHMAGGNGLQTGSSISSGLFGAPVVKENIWSSNNNNNNNTPSNIFVSNGNTNMMQKPATFTFGSSSPFNTNNSTPTFGSSAQPATNIFGMANQNNAQPSVFSSPPQNPAAPSVFGSPAQTHIPSPSMGMFGTPNVSATPTFGVISQPVPSFEATSMTPTPGPAFNFGSPQPSGVFGFGQQAQQQPQQAGVYSFGGAGGAAPQVQFNMGSAPNTTQRRVRKAVRRHPQR